MSAWSAIMIVAAVGAITYSMRAVAILALANRTISPPIQRALRSVGPAVLAALAINLAAGGDGGPSLAVAEGLALFAAGTTAWWRKSLIGSLLAGMVTLWVLTPLL